MGNSSSQSIILDYEVLQRQNSIDLSTNKNIVLKGFEIDKFTLWNKRKEAKYVGVTRNSPKGRFKANPNRAHGFA